MPTNARMDATRCSLRPTSTCPRAVAHCLKTTQSGDHQGRDAQGYGADDDIRADAQGGSTPNATACPMMRPVKCRSAVSTESK